MINYEPELMYALDSKGEYSDWKNVTMLVAVTYSIVLFV